MTKVNPNERPTIDLILEDPFFDELMDSENVTVKNIGSARVGSITEEELTHDVW
jgi:hypothetical protein